jgi:hypothetical protein
MATASQATNNNTITNDEILQTKIEAVCDSILPNVAALFAKLSETNKMAITEFILDLVNVEILQLISRLYT